ncbi:hypothetical protein Rsub_06958 [Raphidocelis subcapitata]|uniref:Protein SirB1 N-terminal domain-containing protein n=1 Tax=Raphidocelis subcapitata TaxID=307507 RepID=A0A2V0P396_9CHLO|nr:hypothetical protein Rsub_06958 [Raphidocelis subcapitata]|eukprot:GBF94336.1 hypothetical protein Rsub_06958 [Raphidocelis subcapitata]
MAAASRRPRRAAPPRAGALDAAADDDSPHMPVALLLAQARLAALEDFRAFASELNSAPLLGGGGFDLPRALAHVARFANPSYEPDEAAGLVASLARAVAQRAEAMAGAQREQDAPSEAAHPENVPSSEARASEDAARRLLALVSVMEEAGFAVNHADPYDPSNTYIDSLLDRRLGTPRSLALLWLAVSRASGLPLAPWSHPGDGVLLKLQLPAGAGGALLADPSNPGSLLLLPDAEDDAPEPDGAPAHWHGAGGSESWSDSMRLRESKLGGFGVKVLGPAAAAELQPMPLRRLLGYALMDAKKTYLMTGLMEEALGIIRYMRALEPWSAGDLRDEGLVLYALGRHQEAYVPLATYLEAAGPGASDAAEISRVVALLESMREGSGGAGGSGGSGGAMEA